MNTDKRGLVPQLAFNKSFDVGKELKESSFIEKDHKREFFHKIGSISYENEKSYTIYFDIQQLS